MRGFYPKRNLHGIVVTWGKGDNGKGGDVNASTLELGMIIGGAIGICALAVKGIKKIKFPIKGIGVDIEMKGSKEENKNE